MTCSADGHPDEIWSSILVTGRADALDSHSPTAWRVRGAR